MPKNSLAVTNTPSQSLQKAKPRYTEIENEILFESWWDPQKRRELVTRLGRKMSALRSQFCRLLKEKGLSNQDYYNMMQAKYTQDSGVAPRKRSREIKDIDRVIFDTFCKHQALGNSRAQACEELQKTLDDAYTPAALKLRFYRLIKRFQYTNDDLIKLGKKLITSASGNEVSSESNHQSIFESTLETNFTTSNKNKTITNSDSENSFLYQISSIPSTIVKLDERIAKIEEHQRYQLDLRGFIEHLLAVERNLKQEDKLMEEIQRLMSENESIQTTLEKEKFRIKKREEELSDLFKMLNGLLNEFMNLESVSKLASLGDFMHRLEITVDQFGNVLKSKKVSYVE